MLARPLRIAFGGASIVFAACAGTPAAAPTSAPTATAAVPESHPEWRPPPRPDEVHFGELKQLTFAGENAEAYFSPDSTQLIFQARPTGEGCDRIYRMFPGAPAPAPIPVSSGAGATTCAFFLSGSSGSDDVIFSSTHLAGPACPPRPDHRNGYVWALTPSYDIFRASRDGKNLRRLTETPGYDAEATVCGRDGSIVFTSVRDGDLDLYRMDADGGNVRRLTNTLGYDGGAFFDTDCSHIVWRASRPKAGAEENEYRALLAQNLVKPTKLELWIADADGGNPMQLTYLDAASFAPSFYPTQPRVIFASNVGDPQGREFDLWAVDLTGANLERITTAPGFDGFPMFSPNGAVLAFASNRATRPGAHDTNVFVARWEEKTVRRAVELPADRIEADITWLADPAREGRGLGTQGLEAAGTYIEARLQRLGLQGAAGKGAFRQTFEVPTTIEVGEATSLTIGGATVARDAFAPAGFATPGSIKRAPMVLAGYGIIDASAGLDDYKGIDARGKIVVARRFAPDVAALADPDKKRLAGDVRRKAFVAREHGARALLVVDAPAPVTATAAPTGKPAAARSPEEASLPPVRLEGFGDSGIPVVFVKRAALGAALARLEHKAPVTGGLNLVLKSNHAVAYNVVARVQAGVPDAERLLGVVVFGAHYDHLGHGDQHSLAPDSHAVHPGADDNASGTATLLEAARMLAATRKTLRRDVLVVGFSAEESGDLGSTHFTRSPPDGLVMSDVVGMVNLDMVGRLRNNQATILGRGTAAEWPALLAQACGAARIDCGGGSDSTADGYGPSDQMPFFAAGVPVAHFFTGSHPDYHRPSDTADKINAAGAGQIALAASGLVREIANRPGRLTMQQAPHPAAGPGDMRTFGASLGTIPDYAGPPAGQAGVLLSGVRAGGPAEKGGLRRGDILIHLGKHDIRSVEDLMYALAASHPGETVSATVLRDGKTVKLPVTFEQGRARP